MLSALGLTHIVVETEETALGMYHEALKVESTFMETT